MVHTLPEEAVLGDHGLLMTVIAAMAVVIVALATLRLALTLTRGNNAVAQGIAGISTGNLSHALEIRSSDEFGAMAKSHREMRMYLQEVAERRERKTSTGRPKRRWQANGGAR